MLDQAWKAHYLNRVIARLSKLPWVEIGILTLAAGLRLALLDIKPPHFDEGVNGWFVDQMTRYGFFRYDPENYHGPLHFYVLFFFQTLFGRNLWALRLPVVVVSVASVWLLLRFHRFFGTGTARLAALAMAVSPAYVFYGRYSIHESWLVAFSILFLWAVLELWQAPGRRGLWALVTAVTGMMVTKETYVIHIVSFALAAGVLAIWQRVVPSRDEWARSLRRLVTVLAIALGVAASYLAAGGLLMIPPFPTLPGLAALPWHVVPALATLALAAFWQLLLPRIAGSNGEWRWTWRVWLPPLATGFVVFVFLYTGNLLAWSSLNGIYSTFAAWVSTGVEAAGHAKKEYDLFSVGGATVNAYWVALMARYEWPALVGLIACVRYVFPADSRMRYVAIFAGGVLVAYSLVAYKTPWCLVAIAWPFYLTFAGVVTELAKRLRTTRQPSLSVAPVAAALAVVAASVIPSVRLNFFEFTNPDHKYVYVQTHRDIDTLTRPLLEMAARDPRYYHAQGNLFLDSYYPLPWILGDFTRIGYYKMNEDPQPATYDADFLAVEKSQADQLEAKLANRYYRRTFHLRDAQEECVAYFREETFRPWFGNQTANFPP